ncbi:MAG: NADPH-dependent curcumin reductase CurA [Parasphingorhabdus sp.]|jgi:NADPH-dependent curcumin reductase CurA
MSDIDQYMPAVQLDDMMRGGTIVEIVASKVLEFSEGMYVMTYGCGWQDNDLVKPGGLRPVTQIPGVQLSIWVPLA